MAERHVIERSTGAELALERDELCLDARTDAPRDVVKVRGSSPYPDGWLVAFSGDLKQGDTRYEKAMFGIRHDDDFPKDVQAYEFALFVQDPGGTEDATMRCVLRVTSRKIEAFGAALAVNTGPGETFEEGVTRLYWLFLNRAPEPGATAHWRTVSGGNIDIVRQGILGSEEYAAKHP